MKTKQEIKDFILKTLLPYKNNPELRSFNEQTQLCMYQAPNGNRCAVGQHIVSEAQEILDFEGNVKELFHFYPKETILSDEALSFNFSITEWQRIQTYHDSMCNSAALGTAIHLLEKTFNIDLKELK